MPEPGGRATSAPLLAGGPEPTLQDLSAEGRRGWSLPELDVPDLPLDLPERAERPPELPEVAERDLVAHFTRLAQRNFAIDVGAYPLGSCSMKYNPKVCDWAAEHPGFRDLHPSTPPELAAGALGVLLQAEELLCEITGMARATFQPPAGASGELTGLLIMRAYHGAEGSVRRRVLIPDSAHGTNPASVTLAGYQAVQVPSDDRGLVDLETLRKMLEDDVAGLMLTNPNTLGLFEEDILEIAAAVHGVGGLLYYDGANLNAILGIARPGDMGFDIVHSNLHKTFATPHGGGGPGAGPVAVTEELVRFLPGPLPVRLPDESLGWEMPEASIGRVHGHHGNFLVVLRALAYMRALGGEGMRRVAERAVLNARYLQSLLPREYEIPYRRPCMHEFVASLRSLKKRRGVRAIDVAKALLDVGFHAPTVYFPLVVEEALMVEPTETESPETIEALAAALGEIAGKADEDPQILHATPRHTPVRRPDEGRAARHLVTTWQAEIIP
ncbi:MAG: aminomethyl-transferring glycine dehydrogenase subunit GcvPB [Actinomycetota bacterium]|nr:aminomethyl-transferring glycine dehydrogenase subunit GcvPB [Actinomycetota bacterium]